MRKLKNIVRLFSHILLDMEAPKRGRPRKSSDEGTEKQIKRREYMRKYVKEIKQGVVQLEKDEEDCLKELEKIRKDKKKLIDDLDKANSQAGGILKEAVAVPKKTVRIVPPKPKPKSYSDDDWFSPFLRKDAGVQLTSVAKRAVAQRKY